MGKVIRLHPNQRFLSPREAELLLERFRTIKEESKMLAKERRAIARRIRPFLAFQDDGVLQVGRLKVEPNGKTGIVVKLSDLERGQKKE